MWVYVIEEEATSLFFFIEVGENRRRRCCFSFLKKKKKLSQIGTARRADDMRIGALAFLLCFLGWEERKG